jgi:hypothetical protein
VPGRKGPFGLVVNEAAKEPECAPPGMVELATTVTVTPGLSKSFIQGVRESLSKLGLRTSWGQVGDGVAVVVVVTVVTEVETEVMVSVDGGIVGHVVVPDWICVMIEVIVEAGSVGQMVEFDFVRVVVTVEADLHTLEGVNVETEVVVDTCVGLVDEVEAESVT